MRSLVLAACLSFPALASAAATEGLPVANAACDFQEPTFDSRKVVCGFDADAKTRRYRLQVNFTGGHDDTTASMTVVLNGAATPCEDGSKTRLMGEDGNVSLTCLFSLEGGQAKPTLAAVFTWNHAQYVDHALTAR